MFRTLFFVMLECLTFSLDLVMWLRHEAVLKSDLWHEIRNSNRSADRFESFQSIEGSTGQLDSRTVGLWIDQLIDPASSVANRRLWDRSLDRLASLDRSADRSRILPEHSSVLDRSLDRSNPRPGYSSPLNRSPDRFDHSNRSVDRLGGLILARNP